MNWRTVVDLMKSTAAQWDEHNAPRLGAAVAYYALLSLAPLVVLIVAIGGVFLNRSTAEADLMLQIRTMVGSAEANTVKSLIDNAHHSGSGLVATVIALATLMFGASGVFVELRDALNSIWDAPAAASGSTWRNLVFQRLVSFSMIVALGFLLVASLAVSAGFTLITKFFTGFLPIQTAVFAETANFVVSLLTIAVLFGLIFKFVPNVPIAWRDVGVGASVTALLFTVGKSLLALYLGTAAVGSTYGAAGSIVALVVWVYYSAQIFFFGAIFTREYAERFGSQRTRRERALQAAASRATTREEPLQRRSASA